MDDWKMYILTYDVDSRIKRNDEKRALKTVLDDWGAIPICKSVWLIKTKEVSTVALWLELKEAAGISEECFFNDRLFLSQITGATEFINPMCCEAEELREALDGVGGINFILGR